MAKLWTEAELLIAMNVYCRLPFGQFDQSNAHIKEVAAKMGRTPSSLSMKLCNLASLDSYHNQRGVSGLKGASKLDRKVWNDFKEDWGRMAAQSEQAFELLMLTDRSEEADLNATIEGPTEILRNVKVRRVQSFFRKAVLGSYENRCALTGLARPELLIASHIIPWSDNKHRRADPTNGICLNSLHDRAFDSHLITFDENLRLVVSDKLKTGKQYGFEDFNFQSMEGKRLRTPHRFAPDQAALAEHRETFSRKR